MVIDSFTGQYRFLSNFWIEPDGTHVEGEYQAMKHEDRNKRAELAALLCRMKPGEARKYGRSRKMMPVRPDWEQVKVKIMYNLVSKKFRDHPALKHLLVATGDAELVEGNTWGDVYWGICRGKGENMLGTILMLVRMELK